MTAEGREHEPVDFPASVLEAWLWFSAATAVPWCILLLPWILNAVTGTDTGVSVGWALPWVALGSALYALTTASEVADAYERRAVSAGLPTAPADPDEPTRGCS